MKNRISKFAAWRAAFLFAALTTSGAAHAYVVTFGDSVKYWAGFPSSVNGQNDQDVIGTPNILGGSVDVGTDGFIDTISITHKKTAGGSAPDLGDLFLDVGNDGDWDFVVDLATRIGYVDTRLNTGTLLSFADGAFPMVMAICPRIPTAPSIGAVDFGKTIRWACRRAWRIKARFWATSPFPTALFSTKSATPSSSTSPVTTGFRWQVST